MWSHDGAQDQENASMSPDPFPLKRVAWGLGTRLIQMKPGLALVSHAVNGKVVIDMHVAFTELVTCHLCPRHKLVAKVAETPL